MSTVLRSMRCSIFCRILGKWFENRFKKLFNAWNEFTNLIATLKNDVVKFTESFGFYRLVSSD